MITLKNQTGNQTKEGEVNNEHLNGALEPESMQIQELKFTLQKALQRKYKEWEAHPGS
ncbi:hypothetical protein [Vibrio sp. R78045]|uniref:hypothetical protein n=1 Tax=Vibrio sp. R78045 TaxID=3093868 RepID=UPI0036F21231